MEELEDGMSSPVREDGRAGGWNEFTSTRGWKSWRMELVPPEGGKKLHNLGTICPPGEGKILNSEFEREGRDN